MKLAYIFTEFPSGQVSNSTRVFAMIERGHDVTVYAQSKGTNVYPDKFLEYQDKFNLIYFNNGKAIMNELVKDFASSPVKSLKRLLTAANKDEFYVNNIKREFGGSTTDRPQIVKRRKPFRYYSILKAFENKNFDVITAFFGTTGANFVFLKKMYPKTLYTTFFVGFDYSSKIYGTGHVTMYDELFEQADIIFAKSTFSKQTLIGLGCAEDKIEIDYNGIDSRKFISKKAYDISDQIKFTIVARLDSKKNHVMILRCFNEILQKQSNFKFNIVGDGRERDNILNFLEENPNLKTHVDFLGKRNQKEISDILMNSDVFMHPSTTAYLGGNMEDTPTSIIEALAVGLPIISTYHAGIPDLVIDGYNGKLVPERNYEPLKNAIQYFLDNASNIQTMGTHSRMVFEDKFSSQKNVIKMETFLLNKMNKTIES